jgi:3-oxoacyl-[acyl-carrier protein] reductase
MKKLSKKIALVTGASKGIGASIAEHLAREGAAVVVNYASSKGGAEEVVGRIKAAGGDAIAVQADIKKGEDVIRLLKETKAKFGRLDILVNNAGVYEFSPLQEITPESFHRHFDTNVLGLLQVTQEAVKLMDSSGGSIINISSVAGRNPPPQGTLYSASKAAVDCITQALAQELGPRKIRVNALAPGMVDTEGVRSAGIADSHWRRDEEKATPLGRIALPEDVARVAVFFASDDSGWITGESVLVAGGRH